MLVTEERGAWRGGLERLGSAKSRAAWLALITAILLFLLLAVAIYDALRSGTPGLLAQLVYLPILLAAAVFGLRGGIVVGLLVAATVTPLLHLGPRGETLGGLWWVKGGLYVLFGVIVGALFQGLANRLRRLERRAERLSEVYTRTLSSLAQTVEVRDRHTQGHSERVARNAMVLGRELGLDERHLELLYWSALLHDLGKIAVPDYILLKDGPLTKREYEEVKRHPVHGAELLRSLASEFAPIAEIVEAHHERWDGLGYPRGRQGAEIPLLSRIISIVDVFEALTSERSYRRPMSEEEALEFILDATGRQFDPTLVTGFEACHGRGMIRSAAGGAPLGTTEPDLPRVLVTQETT